MDVIDTSLRVGVGMAGGGAGLPGGPGGGMGSREKLNPKQHCGFDEEQVAALSTNLESVALLGKGLFKRLLLFEYALNKVMLRHCVSVKQTTDPFLLRTFLPLILGNCFTKWQHYVFIFLRKTLRNLCQEAAHSQGGQPSRHGAVFINNGISRNTIFKEDGYSFLLLELKESII